MWQNERKNGKGSHNRAKAQTPGNITSAAVQLPQFLSTVPGVAL